MRNGVAGQDGFAHYVTVDQLNTVDGSTLHNILGQVSSGLGLSSRTNTITSRRVQFINSWIYRIALDLPCALDLAQMEKQNAPLFIIIGMFVLGIVLQA